MLDNSAVTNNLYSEFQSNGEEIENTQRWPLSCTMPRRSKYLLLRRNCLSWPFRKLYPKP